MHYIILRINKVKQHLFTFLLFQSTFASEKLTIIVQMSSLHKHTGSQSLSPLVDNQVNDGLLQTALDISETLLELNDVVHTTPVVDPLLHDTPDLILFIIVLFVV